MLPFLVAQSQIFDVEYTGRYVFAYSNAPLTLIQVSNAIHSPVAAALHAQQTFSVSASTAADWQCPRFGMAC
jgi:hypothetical protein